MKNKEFITLHLTLRLRPWIYHRLDGVELLGGGERVQGGVGAPPQSRRNDTGAENVVQPYEISC